MSKGSRDRTIDRQAYREHYDLIFRKPDPDPAELEIGDYVLATKYGDGDPRDHWCVGYYNGIIPGYVKPRYDVVDEYGRSFRGNGFRRVEPVSDERGQWLLNHGEEIEMSGVSVWVYAKAPMED